MTSFYLFIWVCLDVFFRSGVCFDVENASWFLFLEIRYGICTKRGGKNHIYLSIKPKLDCLKK